MNGNRVSIIENLEQNNPRFLQRLDKIASDLINSENRHLQILDLEMKGYRPYLKYLLALVKEKHYNAGDEIQEYLQYNPKGRITDLITEYESYTKSSLTRKLLEEFEESLPVPPELLDEIGISQAEKERIDDQLISFKELITYEWRQSDLEVANFLQGQKSLSEKSSPDSPLRRYYFDQIDLSVKLNGMRTRSLGLNKRKSIKKYDLSIEEFALLRFYQNKPVDENNMAEAIQDIGYTSGDKLKDRYQYWYKPSNRLAVNDLSKQKLKNKIERIEGILKYLDNEQKIKPLDELKLIKRKAGME